ncbi:MAG: AAC(3) family N-acetyltransferase [Planctomycetes bacterium]|nr:AAC(3) family N-acetyltransferase [Planctomycetota bacterium]
MAGGKGLTAEEIAEDLRVLGLKRGDIVLVHSSLRAMGLVEGGAGAVVEGVVRAVGAEGTAMFPTLTGSKELGPSSPPVFDPAETKCWTGAIPEAARMHGGALRSLHPTHSTAAIGALRGEMCYAHEVSATPCGWETPYLRAARSGGKVVFIGCDLASNTTYHGVEEAAGVPYHMQRGWTDAEIRTGGNVRTVRVRLHYYGPGRNFNVLNGELEKMGVLKRGAVGAARAILVESGPMVETALEALSRDAELFLAEEEKGKGWGDGSHPLEV